MTEDTFAELKEKLHTVLETTQRQENAIAELVQVTSDQAQMIDQMWKSVDPILKRDARSQELKQEVLIKVMSGSVWAIMVGAMLVAWKGFKIYIAGD